MNAPYRRARLLALFLDVAIPAAIVDAVSLPLSAAAWRFWPAAREQTVWLWVPASAAAVAAFLLRDANGGRARRWMALEVRREDGRPPGGWGSIRRNLALLLPGWNLIDAWPALRDGAAARRSDRRAGLRIVPCD
ncbi:MAG TPA: RDD family protein [Thermoanaerobaculia bacterium]|jgi:hypothetical protein